MATKKKSLLELAAERDAQEGKTTSTKRKSLLELSKERDALAERPIVEREDIEGESFLNRISPTATKLATAPSKFILGQAKGAASTAFNLGQIGARGLSALTRIPLAGGVPQKPSFLDPQGAAQKAGYLSEQVGEFFAPVGQAAKGLAVEKLGTKLAQTPKLAQLLGNIGAKSAIEGTEALGRAAIQRGEVDSQAKLAGALGLASPALGASVGLLSKRLGNFFYSTAVPTTITQRGKDFATGLNIGEAVGETGVSLTRKQFMEKISGRIGSLGSELGSAIDDAVKVSPKKTYTINQIAKDIKSSILDNQAVRKRLNATPIDMVKIEQSIDDTINGYRELIGKKRLNANDLQALKVALGDGLETTFKKALDAPVKAKALTEIKLRQKLKETIEDVVPKARELNKQLAPLFEAQARLKKKGNYSGYLTDVLAGGFASGGIGEIATDPVDYAKNFALGVVAKRLGTSTASKTLAGTIANDVAKVVSSPTIIQTLRRLFEPKKD